jgi:hypothetical protein
MKRILLISAFLINYGFTWNYLTSENGKAGTRIKLNDESRTFRFSDRKCTIEETVKPKPGQETRALICEIGENQQVMSTAVCVGDGKTATEKNLADLSFISAKAVVSVLLYCD